MVYLRGEYKNLSMNKLLFIFSFSILLFACNEQPQTSSPSIDKNKYPEILQKIFSKHGGIKAWQKMKSLSYEIVKEEGNEKQFIHLQDRRERIEASNFTTGFDGKDIWIEADTSYKGNAVFHHNLMFYFYAMPFVLADDGIIYSVATPLEFEGKTYPGLKIAYDTGIGISPEDEYFIHYDPSTFKMAWLGYTVTYFSKEKSKETHWIRYNDWKKINGLLLSNSLTWYDQEEGKLTEAKSTRLFDKVSISETAFEDAVFERTEAAIVAE